MVLPLEWEKQQKCMEEEDAPIAESNAGHSTGDTTRAALALLEEMEKNRLLTRQIEMARSLFTMEQNEEWRRRCSQMQD